MPEQRRFPKPWKVVENEESFEVQAANDFPMVYLYFADDFKRNWAFNRGRPTKDEARRIANAIARLPELLLIEKAAKSQAPDIPE
jgi:hypothetical protein